MKTYNPLKRLRGLKRYMDAVFLAAGTILVPLGFYLRVEQQALNGLGTGAVLLGLVCWVLAYYVVKGKEKREHLERVKEQKRQNDALQGQHEVLVSILKELEKLNQGRKQGDFTTRGPNSL